MTAGVSGRESGIKNMRLRHQRQTGNWQKVQAVGTCVCTVYAEAPPIGPTMIFGFGFGLPQLPNTHSSSCSSYIEVTVCLEVFRVHEIDHCFRLPVVHNFVVDPAIFETLSLASLACDNGSSASPSTGEREDRGDKESNYRIASSNEEVTSLG